MDYLSHSSEVSGPSPHHLPQSCPAAHSPHAHGPFSRGQLSNPSMLQRYNPNQPYETVHSHPHHYPPIHSHSWGPHNPGALPWSPLPPISAPSFPHIQGHSQQMTQSRMPAPHLSEPYPSSGSLQYPTPSSLPPPSHVSLSFSSQQPSHSAHAQPTSSTAGQHHGQLPEAHYSSPPASSRPPNLPSPASEPNQAGAQAGAQGGGPGAGASGPIRHSGPPPAHSQRSPYHPSHNHYQRLSGQYSGGPPPPVSQPTQQTPNHHPNGSGPYPFSYERSYQHSYSSPGNGGANNIGSYSVSSSVAQGPSMSSPPPGPASGPASNSGPTPTSSSTGTGGISNQNRPHSLYSSSGQEYSASSSSGAGGPSVQLPQSSTSTQGYPVPSPAPLSAHPPHGNPRHSFPYNEYITPPYQPTYLDNIPPPAPPTLTGTHHHHHHHHHHHPPPPPPPENRRRVHVGRPRRHTTHRASIPDMDSDDDYGPSADMMEQVLLRDMTNNDGVRAAQLLRGALSSKMVASPSAIASLESVSIDSLPENERSCIICYNDFGTDTPEGVNEAPLRLPECKHIFGDHCIKKWFEDSDSCPYCRSKVPAQPRTEMNHRALQEYIRARGHPNSEAAILRLMARGGFIDLPDSGSTSSAGSTGSRRSPPTDGAGGGRRIRARFSGPSSHRESGSSSSTSTGGSNRPQSFAGSAAHTPSLHASSPPHPSFGGPFDRDGSTPPMPTQSTGSQSYRLDRMNASPTRTRPFSAIHSHGDGYSSSVPHNRASADLQFGFFSRQSSQQSQPLSSTPHGGRPSMTGSVLPLSDAGQTSAGFFSNGVSPMQQQRPVDGNASAQAGNEDVPMPDLNPGPDPDARPVPRNSL